MPTWRVIRAYKDEASKLPKKDWVIESDHLTNINLAKEELAYFKYNYRGENYVYNCETGVYDLPLPNSRPFVYALYQIPDEECYWYREIQFQEAGAYTRLDLDHYYGNPWYYPYLTEDKRVSFFETERNAGLNIRTEKTLASFLTNYLSLSEEQIDNELVRHGIDNDEYVLKFATSRQEIQHVYVNGPRSCMSGTAVMQYDTHPAEAFASPDFAVAYVVRGEDRIVARAVVRADKKQFVSIYGMTTRMRNMLEKEGYTENPTCLVGGRLLKIYFSESQIVMLPYLDGNYSYRIPFDHSDKSEFLTIEVPPLVLQPSTAGFARV